MKQSQYAEIYLCKHNLGCFEQGLALITVGNNLRGDDGVASQIVQLLPKTQDFCIFNLGSFTNYLSYCLHGHEAIIIIDAIFTQNSKGKVKVFNLNQSLLSGNIPNNLSSHGFSFIDELNFSGTQKLLPPIALFFGIEINNKDGLDIISNDIQKQFSSIVKQLTELILEVKNNIAKPDFIYARNNYSQ